MNYCILTMRIGSKRIPKKNLYPFLGEPLCIHVIREASNTPEIDKVICLVDSEEIEDTIFNYNLPKVEIVLVPIMGDQSKTDFVIHRELSKRDFNDEDTIILTQVTSPLTTSFDFSESIKLYNSRQYDSLLSATKFDRFIWEKDSNGISYSPVNYDPENRVRTQDIDSYFMENGAIYISSYKRWMDTKCRITGSIGVYEMKEITGIEIDSEDDIKFLESKMRSIKDDDSFKKQN